MTIKLWKQKQGTQRTGDEAEEITQKVEQKDKTKENRREKLLWQAVQQVQYPNSTESNRVIQEKFPKAKNIIPNRIAQQAPSTGMKTDLWLNTGDTAPAGCRGEETGHTQTNTVQNGFRLLNSSNGSSSF